MRTFEDILAEAFPTWSWNVSGVHDEVIVYGRRDGFEPLKLDIRTRNGGFRVALEIRDAHYVVTGESLRACAEKLRDAVTRTEVAHKLYAAALRSLKAKVAK